MNVLYKKSREHASESDLLFIIENQCCKKENFSNKTLVNRNYLCINVLHFNCANNTLRRFGSRLVILFATSSQALGIR